MLSFMMGVTTLSLPSIIMLRKAVKPKLLGIFIGICAAGIIIVGYLFNAIQFLRSLGRFIGPGLPGQLPHGPDPVRQP